MTENNIRDLYALGRKQIENKTRLYLSPCMAAYGKEFINKLRQFSSPACGLDDASRASLGEPVIYTLLNIERSRIKQFIPEILYFRKHTSYMEDYLFGETLYSKLHMLILKMPEQYIETYYAYLKGAYSKMYNNKELVKLFYPVPGDPPGIAFKKRKAFSVLSLDDELRCNIAEEYGVPVGLVTELDSKPEPLKEIFNYNYNTECTSLTEFNSERLSFYKENINKSQYELSI